LTPEALVKRAVDRGLTLLALTDHDDTSGLVDAHAAAGRSGLTLISGVEISVTWRGQTLHVVGLGINPAHAGLQAGLAAIRNGRRERADKIVAAFDALGIAGSCEGAREFSANAGLISRTHFARFLVARGLVKDMKSAFKRFLGGGQPCYVPHQWASLDAAVRWINGSGGVAVIAHPARCAFDNAQMCELLAEFRALGGAAIEVVSSSHTQQQRAIFAAHARKFGLAASTGSDFHSPAESYCDLGSLPALPAGLVPVWELLGVTPAPLHRQQPVN
jgi:predicted metal-dependent phosphoesterase TrpH